MNLRTKITLLTTLIIMTVGFLTTLSVRGVIINAFRDELEKKGVSIANNLSGRIADFIPVRDYFRTTEALQDILEREKDIEYIFLTDEEGNIFSHTLGETLPSKILTWNPLGNEAKKVQLLDTEKGYIRDIGV